MTSSRDRDGVIGPFKGEYEFLSNFYESLVCYRGVLFKTAENAFQAAKTLNIAKWPDFQMCSPSEAKKKGRQLMLRPDWEMVKSDIMLEILRDKFGLLNDRPQAQELGRRLLDTGDAILIEFNTWHDNCWGVCTCGRCQGEYGQNLLGIELMQVRKELALARGA